MITIIKIIMYSIFGYYIINIYKFLFNKKIKINYYGVIFPLYSIYLLSNKIFDYNNLILIYTVGIITGLLIKIIYTLYNNQKLNINIIYFGIFNLINKYILDKFIYSFLISSTINSTFSLFIILLIPYIFDISLSMRKI